LSIIAFEIKSNEKAQVEKTSFASTRVLYILSSLSFRKSVSQSLLLPNLASEFLQLSNNGARGNRSDFLSLSLIFNSLTLPSTIPLFSFDQLGFSFLPITATLFYYIVIWLFSDFYRRLWSVLIILNGCVTVITLLLDFKPNQTL
jgi:hypothetical protein